jgi:4-amino-4-deoxy-L-arabinose transferase-like glycosyltransferase
LKAWLYWPIFAVWRPGVYSLRIPVLLAAGFTLWLWYRLLRRTVGTGAALAVCALLATDTMFVLTSVLDWGPVVLQHLLAALALWLALRFHEAGQRWRLALAAFCCGLALWDKAAFAWTLAGFVVGAAVAFPREIRRTLGWRNSLIAVVCLSAGALPLIYANWGGGPALIRDAGGFSPTYLGVKAAMALDTLDGSALFGYLTREDAPPKTPPPVIALDRASVALSEALGNPFESWLPWALVAAVLLLPFLWRTPARRPLLFSLLAGVTGWLIIASMGRGGSSHHVVLLWPLPHMLVGIAAAQVARWRRHAGKLVAVLVAAVCLSSLAVTNQYLADLVRRGCGLPWTDASAPLAHYLRRAAPVEVWALDWGIVGPLRIEGGRRLPVRGWLSMDPGWEARERAGHRNLISSPERLFVVHAPGSEIFPGRREALAAFARKEGYREEVRRVIHDRQGRAVFEVLRFVRTEAPR